MCDMNMKSSQQRSIGRRMAGVTMPIVRKRMKWYRNWTCLCGSGKKYKRCCMNEINSLTASDDNANITPIPKGVKTVVDYYQKKKEDGSVKKDV